MFLPPVGVKSSVSLVKNVVNPPITDIARKVVQAVEDGRLEVGERLSLAEFARQCDIPISSARRLLDVLDILEEADLEITRKRVLTNANAVRYFVSTKLTNKKKKGTSRGSRVATPEDLNTGDLPVPPKKIDWSRIKPAGRRPRRSF